MSGFQKQGGEILVNTLGAGFQDEPSISMLPNGGFVATWVTNSPAPGGSGLKLKAQIFDANGMKQGTEFYPGLVTGTTEYEPAVTTLTNGNFVIAWSDTDNADIYLRIFNASGTAQGAEFVANTETVDTQYTPTIAALDGGGFVVAWDTQDATQDGSSSAIKAQVFGASGSTVGSEILVNTETNELQLRPSVASLTDGGFAVSWTTTDMSQDGWGNAIKARLFDASGNPDGAEFLVNTQAQFYQGTSATTGLSNGGFVVAWVHDQDDVDTSRSSIKAQLFDATGDEVGGEFLVNSALAEFQRDPAVISLADGGFVVAWETTDTSQDGDDTAIKAQVFNASGSKRGSEFLVNTEATDWQDEPVISGLADGGFVVSWTTRDATQDGDRFAVKAQMYDPVGPQQGTSGEDTITGTSGDDNFELLGGNDDFTGLAGDDTALGQGGNDTLRGNGGDDTLSGGSGSDSLIGGGNNDTIDGDEGSDTILGGGGNDSLFGGNARDSIDGGSGNDYLNGEGFTDTLLGGTGNDTMFGGGSSDTLYGEENDDELFGNNAADFLDGGSGNDVLNGGKSNDELRGGSGNDSLLGSTGDDRLYGDGGADVFQFRANHGTLDRIYDFQDGVDTIEFNINSVDDISDLTLTNVFSGVDIDYGSGVIRVLGLSEADFSNADFAFL